VLHLLQGTVDQLLALVAAGGLEGAGVPWPGSIIVAGAGLTSGGGWPALCLMATAFSVTYCLGALAQYGIGRALGAAALTWLSDKQRMRLETMMARYGTGAVLWTRPLAIGNYVSIPAGIMRMPVLKFLLYTLLGIWPWAFGMLLIGRSVSSWFADLQATLQPWLLPSVAAAIGCALLAGGWKYLRQRQQAGASDI
jgi:membrane protein DedA with SNARE-associated domain